MFHHLALFTSLFYQIHICPSSTRQTEEWLKSQSTQPGTRPTSSSCTYARNGLGNGLVFYKSFSFASLKLNYRKSIKLHLQWCFSHVIRDGSHGHAKGHMIRIVRLRLPCTKLRTVLFEGKGINDRTSKYISFPNFDTVPWSAPGCRTGNGGKLSNSWFDGLTWLCLAAAA